MHSHTKCYSTTTAIFSVDEKTDTPSSSAETEALTTTSTMTRKAQSEPGSPTWNSTTLSPEMQQRKQVLRQATQNMVGYNASHRYSESMRVFHTLQRQHIEPDIVVANLYLEALAAQGRVDEMFQLFFQEIKPKLPLNIITFNNLMKGLILNGDADRAEELFVEIEKAQLQPNIFTYNSFFEVTCRFNRYRQGWKMYEQMVNRNKTVPRHLQVMPNINTFKSLITLSLGARMGVSAYDFLREAESYKLTLEEEIYNKVFCACIKVEHPDGCLYLAQALETRFKRVHDEGTYLRIMNIGAKKGRFDVSETMWTAMERAGIAFRSPMYHTMLAAYAKSGRIEEAFRTIHAMERDNVPIHYPSLRPLVDILSSGTAEDIDRAYYLLLDMMNAGEQVSLVSLNIIVEACSAIRDLDRAFATINEYSKFSHTPNLQSFNALLNGCVRVRQMSTCFKIFADIRENGFEPDALTYRLMIVCCIRSFNIERALDVFDEMIESKVRPDNPTFVVLLRHARRMSEPRLIEKLTHTMMSLGINPDNFRAFISDQNAIDTL